jgi:anthranilate phosphoribosyltransferase
LKSVAPFRKQLGLKTFFNLLGPLVNPARPDFTMIGVANLKLREFINIFCKNKKRVYVVHALDGYDEISLTGDTKIFNKNGEKSILRKI